MATLRYWSLKVLIFSYFFFLSEYTSQCKHFRNLIRLFNFRDISICLYVCAIISFIRFFFHFCLATISFSNIFLRRTMYLYTTKNERNRRKYLFLLNDVILHFVQKKTYTSNVEKHTVRAWIAEILHILNFVRHF